MRVLFWSLILSGWIMTSCGPATGADAPRGTSLSAAGTPSIFLVDSMVIEEPDSIPLGQFVQVARDGRGRTYISDASSGRILRFTSTGTFDTVWGRRGSGPGEYASVDMLHPLPGDSLAAVMDLGTSRLTVLSLADGAVRRTFRVPIIGAGKQWHFVDGRATFSVPGSPSLVGIWDMAQDTLTTSGMLPPDLMGSLYTYMRYGHLEIAPWHGGYVAQVPALPGLQQLNTSGAIVGRIALPSSTRRGQPSDLLAQHQQLEAGGKPFTYIRSAAATLGVLSSGELAAVQVDIDAQQGPERTEYTDLKYYVSILSADLKHACLDALVPFTSDAPLPIPYLVGDTLVALSRLVGSDDQVHTVIHRFQISSVGCAWTAQPD